MPPTWLSPQYPKHYISPNVSQMHHNSCTHAPMHAHAHTHTNTSYTIYTTFENVAPALLAWAPSEFPGLILAKDNHPIVVVKIHFCVCVCLRGSVNSAWAATCPHQCEWLAFFSWELIPSIMGTTTIIYIAYVLRKLHTYKHKSSTQNAPALRTRDGGLKIFYDRLTLPTHPVSQTLMHNDLHFISSYIPWALSKDWELAKLWLS